jgi:hypothetical protein
MISIFSGKMMKRSHISERSARNVKRIVASVILMCCVTGGLFSYAHADPLRIRRIELYFDNKRPEITVKRNYADLRAFADIAFTGSGLLEGFWEVDGRVLSQFSHHILFSGTLTLETPPVPNLPTFEPGTHIVKFIITRPEDGIPLPSMLYFVTPGEQLQKTVELALVSPDDNVLLEYAPVEFTWKGFDEKTFYVIQFYERPEDKPIFSICVDSTSYELKGHVLNNIFFAGRSYYWQVKGGREDDMFGESTMRTFYFKKKTFH